MIKDTEAVLWGIHAGKTGDADNLFLKKNCVAVGWAKMGDLSALKPERGRFFTLSTHPSGLPRSSHLWECPLHSLPQNRKHSAAAMNPVAVKPLSAGDEMFYAEQGLLPVHFDQSCAQDWSLYSQDRLHFTPDGSNFGGEKRVLRV